MKIIKYFFEFILIIILFSIFKLLRRKISSDLGCSIVTYICCYFRSEKRILTNLRKAFPKINF